MKKSKNSLQIIKDHEGLFLSVSDVTTVVGFDYSLSEVDMEYFERICRKIKKDTKWIFNCYDSNGLKSIDSFVNEMGIDANNITEFRL